MEYPWHFNSPLSFRRASEGEAAPHSRLTHLLPPARGLASSGSPSPTPHPRHKGLRGLFCLSKQTSVRYVQVWLPGEGRGGQAGGGQYQQEGGWFPLTWPALASPFLLPGPATPGASLQEARVRGALS